jgi:hypothetical protein
MFGDLVARKKTISVLSRGAIFLGTRKKPVRFVLSSKGEKDEVHYREETTLSSHHGQLDPKPKHMPTPSVHKECKI